MRGRRKMVDGVEGEDILLRKDAVAQGAKSYFTGKECLNGHVSRRQVSSGQCMECKRIHMNTWRGEGYTPATFKTKPVPSKEYLLERFHYDEEKGALFWKARDVSHFAGDSFCRAWHKRFLGVRAGSLHYANNYIEVRLDGKLYKAHRLVWKILYGSDSTGMLDHINGLPYDNRPSNLREATAQDNARNAKGRGKYKGVSECNGGFIGSYCINDIHTFSESYSTAREAAKWYDRQVKFLYKDFAYLNFKEEK
jgi:hypothetical protein